MTENGFSSKQIHLTCSLRGGTVGCTDLPWGPTIVLYNRYRVFPGGKERPGRDADPSPPSAAVVKKEWSYTSTAIGCTAGTNFRKATVLLSLFLSVRMEQLSSH